MVEDTYRRDDLFGEGWRGNPGETISFASMARDLLQNRPSSTTGQPVTYSETRAMGYGHSLVLLLQAVWF